MNITLRQLEEGDARSYRALRMSMLMEFPEAFGMSPEEELSEPLEILERKLRDGGTQNSGFVLGAFHGDRLKGVVGIHKSPYRKSAHSGSVWGMYVVADARRGGIGRSLLMEAIELAGKESGLKRLQLCVGTSNTAAVSLYRSAGFIQWGTQVDALRVQGKSYDEHFMSLAL